MQEIFSVMRVKIHNIEGNYSITETKELVMENIAGSDISSAIFKNRIAENLERIIELENKEPFTLKSK